MTPIIDALIQGKVIPVVTKSPIVESTVAPVIATPRPQKFAAEVAPVIEAPKVPEVVAE